MIPTPPEFASQRGFGTKVPGPMANPGGYEGQVVLLERKDSPAKLLRQSSDR